MGSLDKAHSLYDQLGVEPSADQEQLRQAYRRRARELHPDINAGLKTGSAMQQLNAAWAVLGDPQSRQRYDQERYDQERSDEEQSDRARSPHVEPAAPSPQDYRDQPIAVSSAIGCLGMLFRPTVLIPAVLFVIFVFTAYAGHGGGSGPTPSPTTSVAAQAGVGAAATTSTLPPAALVGRCIRDQPEVVEVVPCSELPNSMVIAAMPTAGLCPTGTTGYQLSGMAEMLCASPNGP